MMMAGKGRVYLAVVAVIVAAAVPVSVLSVLSAGASTTVCGSACMSLAVQSSTGDYLTVSGSSVGMATASTTSTSQDFTLEAFGLVQAAADDGVVSARLAWMYGGGTLVEFQYAPGGIPSGNCLADGSTPPSVTNNVEFYAPNTSVTLTTCGETAATLWIEDPLNGQNTNGYDDLINAGYAVPDTYSGPEDTDGQTLTSPFEDPDVLTLNSSGKVVLAELSEINDVVSPGQMWFGGSALTQQVLKAAAKSAAARRAAGKS
jgi:hypothetical protein